MATQVPPEKNAAYTFAVSLTSQASSHIFQTSVTLAAGDVTVSLEVALLALAAVLTAAGIDLYAALLHLHVPRDLIIPGVVLAGFFWIGGIGAAFTGLTALLVGTGLKLRGRRPG